MASKKSQDLQLARWRLRRAGGVTFRSYLSLESGEDQCPSSKKVRKREIILPYYAFVVVVVLFRPSAGWMGLSILERAISFPQYTDSSVNFIQKHPDTI